MKAIPMMSLLHDYEIRIQRPDGRLSIHLFMLASLDHEAGKLASQMLSDRLSSAFVWRDGTFIGSLHQIGTTLRSQGLRNELPQNQRDGAGQLNKAHPDYQPSSLHRPMV